MRPAADTQNMLEILGDHLERSGRSGEAEQQKPRKMVCEKAKKVVWLKKLL
jgi:hypothetical protein